MSTEPNLQVVFFHTPGGRKPVREWLQELDKDVRKVIGEDVKAREGRT